MKNKQNIIEQTKRSYYAKGYYAGKRKVTQESEQRILSAQKLITSAYEKGRNDAKSEIKFFAGAILTLTTVLGFFLYGIISAFTG
jgi:hypothetical protein